MLETNPALLSKAELKQWPKEESATRNAHKPCKKPLIRPKKYLERTPQESYVET